MNPNGHISVLEIDHGQYLTGSNAILFYLSQGIKFLPVNTWQQAQIMQWLFFEQYSHESNIATSRYWLSILKESKKQKDTLEQKQKAGYAALGVTEKHLAQYDFFVGNQYSITDIALYAYTYVAHEGNFDLGSYSNICIWLKQVSEQPRYLRISA
ncbi:glutathione S-transferase family protein [[Limnothrix rosea] IAM M-220]|uniref:glutathione S-transferase family protein n=1 Tax=[Limnothrix rosea] IAM M-220 TaxID=454133 RepID=UPI0009FFD413|nr:glutathione S-transferase family protein [[Limnothrix rosea] IAM M-220]